MPQNQNKYVYLNEKCSAAWFVLSLFLARYTSSNIKFKKSLKKMPVFLIWNN